MTGKGDAQRFTAANQLAWDEAALRHEPMMFLFRRAFASPGYVFLEEALKQRLEAIGLEGKSVCQLCCNDGRDLLSVRNLGAARCVGVDISERFVEHARELAAIAGHSETVQFVTADVYDLPRAYDESFEIVLATVGVLRWMPDLKAFLSTAARLLRGGGYLVIEDMHPVLSMFTPRTRGVPSHLAFSYFEQGPFQDLGIDYCGGDSVGGEAKPAYRFQHTLAQILMTAIDIGLKLRWISELAEDLSLVYQDLERAAAKPPLGFLVAWQK